MPQQYQMIIIIILGNIEAVIGVDDKCNDIKSLFVYISLKLLLMVLRFCVFKYRFCLC